MGKISIDIIEAEVLRLSTTITESFTNGVLVEKTYEFEGAEVGDIAIVNINKMTPVFANPRVSGNDEVKVVYHFASGEYSTSDLTDIPIEIAVIKKN